MAVDLESSSDGELTVKSNGAFRKTYKFDAVFGPQADQCKERNQEISIIVLQKLYFW